MRVTASVQGSSMAAFRLSAALLAACISACGGGGGGSTPSGSVDVPANPVTPPAPTPTPTTPIVPPPIATVDDALNELNRFRVAAGVNPLTLNAQVAVAATAHAKYMVTSATGGEDPHGERVGAPNFTGVDARARIVAAGYSNLTSASEVAAGVSLGSPRADPKKLVRGLMNAPYHGLAMLAGFRDAGVGFQSGNHTVVVVDFAAAGESYLPIPSQEVRMFPCNGIDNMLNQTDDNEVPTPIAGRSLLTDPIGTPVYVLGREGTVLSLTSHEIRNLQTNEVVPIVKVLGDSAGDNVQANKRAILPNRPLALGTTYRATVTGLNNGLAFSKTCEFKTGI